MALFASFCPSVSCLSQFSLARWAGRVAAAAIRAARGVSLALVTVTPHKAMTLHICRRFSSSCVLSSRNSLLRALLCLPLPCKSAHSLKCRSSEVCVCVLGGGGVVQGPWLPLFLLPRSPFYASILWSPAAMHQLTHSPPQQRRHFLLSTPAACVRVPSVEHSALPPPAAL